MNKKKNQLTNNKEVKGPILCTYILTILYTASELQENIYKVKANMDQERGQASQQKNKKHHSQ